MSPPALVVLLLVFLPTKWTRVVRQKLTSLCSL